MTQSYVGQGAPLSKPVAQSDLTQIRAVMFDLDGTLLQVEMSRFIPRYIEGLAACCADLVSFDAFRRAMLAAIRVLIRGKADGRSNERRFLTLLEAQLGIAPAEFRHRLETFRQEHLEGLSGLIEAIPQATELVELCRRRGVKLVLATNPVFPRFMIEARQRWGGLGRVSFDHVTSYENSCFCKPNSGYFQEVAEAVGEPAEACLMVGNDTSHDLAATEAGMTTYLVDTFLVERQEQSWTSDFRGNHEDLQRFLQARLPLLDG